MKKPKLITKVEGQIDLMAGLTQVNKKDFINIFCDKYKVSKKPVSLELTAINRDYGIGNYHNKGFIFSWGELISGGRNWGIFTSSFNIDNPNHIITICYNPIPHFGQTKSQKAIHCNIYKKYTDIKLPSVVNSYIMRICFYGAQDRAIENFVKIGKLYDVLQVGRNMFKNNSPYDGLWDQFKVGKCKICDEQINEKGQEVCAKCLIE